jgi:hypothetical protein
VKRRLNRCSWEPEGNDVSVEADDSPLLDTVSRKRLVETVTD